MGFRFTCPTTGHKIETLAEIDDGNALLFRAGDMQTRCSFCGGSHEWVLIKDCVAPIEVRKIRRRRHHSGIDS